MIPTKKPIPQKPLNAHAQQPAKASGSNKKTLIWIAVAIAVAVAAGVVALFLFTGSGKIAQESEEEVMEFADTTFVEIPDISYDEMAEVPAIPEEDDFIGMDDDPVKEATPEEILNEGNFTELKVVKDEEVETSFDKGTDDINVVRSNAENDIMVDVPPKPAEDEKIYTTVEQMPNFPGGDSALYKYIAEHIKYPAAAMENNIQGKVVVKFVVKRDGSIGDVQVVRGKDPDLDREAVRVVKTLPKFIPGKMNGKSVNVWYTLPVNFKLQGV